MKKLRKRSIVQRIANKTFFTLIMTLICSLIFTSQNILIKKDVYVYASTNENHADNASLYAGVSREFELILNDISTKKDMVEYENIQLNQSESETLYAGISREIELILNDSPIKKDVPDYENTRLKQSNTETLYAGVNREIGIILNDIPITESCMTTSNNTVSVESTSETNKDNEYQENMKLQNETNPVTINTKESNVELESEFNGEYITTLSRCEEKFVPSDSGKIHTYMAWQCITDKSSHQYKLRMAAQNFDDEGFGKIGDRYAVAVKPYYGEIGDYLDITQTDGLVYKVVIADFKGNENGDSGNAKYIHHDGSLIEFVVDKGMWYSTTNGGWNSRMHTNPGTKKFHPELGLNIAKIENVGNYWDYDHELMNQ